MAGVITMLEMLFMPFVVKAMACSVMIGAICAWMGIFVTLNKMAFFSESVSHSAITGIALALLFQLDISVFLVFFSVAIAAVIAMVSQSSYTSKDSVIGIIHSTTIAVGIIILSFIKGGNSDLSRYLFGDVLAIRNIDMIICATLFAASIAYLLIFGKKHMVTCLIPEFSVVEGISVKFYDFMLMITLALVISISVKIVGAILVTALLIIPSNASKNITASFSKFRMFSIVFGVLGAFFGIIASVYFDVPAGPAIIAVNSLFYFMTLAARNVFGVRL